MERRYDIDWLRVIAIWILILYHIGIGFQPWGVFIGFLQNDPSMTSIWVPMSWMNIWRIPLLFFVAGMGVQFSMRKRSWKQLMGERTMRIFVPLLAGSLVLIPLHTFLWQDYYQQDLKYVAHPGHLWFLGNILLYVLALSPLFYYLKKKQETRLHGYLQKLFSSPIGYLGIMSLLIGETYLFTAESYATFAFNLHGFAVGFIAFLSGYLIVYSGEKAFAYLVRWKWITLGLALGLFLFRWLHYELAAPNYLIAIESPLWILSALAFAKQFLNKPTSLLGYLSPAAYPVYIFHMLFLYLGSWLVFPMEIAPWIKFFIVAIITFIGCYGSYEAIKRVKGFRVLFGMKG